MIELLDRISFSIKKKLILSALLTGFIIMMIGTLFIQIKDEKNVDVLFIDAYFHAFDILFRLLLSFSMTWIIMDMTHPFEKMIASYHGKIYCIFYKCLNILIWSLILSSLYMFLSSTIYLLVLDKLPSKDELRRFMHLFLDLLMIGLSVSYLSRLKHPSLSIIVFLIFTLYSILSENRFLLTLYYVLPFYQTGIIHYQLALYYKVCYIYLGLHLTWMIHVKN